MLTYQAIRYYQMTKCVILGCGKALKVNVTMVLNLTCNKVCTIFCNLSIFVYIGTFYLAHILHAP